MKICSLAIFSFLALSPNAWALLDCLRVFNDTNVVMYMRCGPTGTIKNISISYSRVCCANRPTSPSDIYYAFSRTSDTQWDHSASFNCQTRENYNAQHTYRVTGSSSNWEIDAGYCTETFNPGS